MAILIETVADLLNVLSSHAVAEKPGSSARFMYRGHGDSSWCLEPGVYRPTFKFHFDKTVEEEETARLRTESHLFQDFRIMSAGLRSGKEDDTELYFLQQHYGMPTRLLDWSNNPLAALYFAVSNQRHDGISGSFFVMDAFKLAGSQSAPEDAGITGVATSSRKYVKETIEIISCWKPATNFGAYAIALRPDHIDKRMSIQRSCFTLHPPARNRLVVKDIHCIQEYSIPANAKAPLRVQLATLGVDDFSIYGDLDHLASRLVSAYCK